MRKINIAGVVSGLITLYLAILGGSWWVARGGAGGESFHAFISPFTFDVSILGNPVDVPLINWLILASRIAFISAGLEIIVASILVHKDWSKSFIRLRILWTAVIFVASIYVGVTLVQNITGISVPIQGEAMLTYELPFQTQTVTLEAPFNTYFTPTFEVALVGGVSALLARIIHGKVTKVEPAKPTEADNNHGSNTHA
jgi:hypothetical protein